MVFMELIKKVVKGIWIIYPKEEKIEIFPIDFNLLNFNTGLGNNYETLPS